MQPVAVDLFTGTVVLLVPADLVSRQTRRLVAPVEKVAYCQTLLSTRLQIQAPVVAVVVGTSA
jgi:hypothetical protein